MGSSLIAVIASRPAARHEAKRIASEFGMTMLDSGDDPAKRRYRYQLQVSASSAADFTSAVPALLVTDASHGPICIDFTQGRAAHRRQFGGGRKQPLARAAGISKKNSNSIIDATAGYGNDAFVLASLGCSVTLIERNPALAAMLQYAIAKARQTPATGQIAQRMHLLHADARACLCEQVIKCKAETIYLDPMYPHKGKSALAKKPMQALQSMIGPDTDSALLLECALDCATQRVVVKRPKGALALSGPAPDHSIASSNTRYDIYHIG